MGLAALANYRIQASLDWPSHTLTGTAHVEWINTSSDTVPDLWLHLYPNAFRRGSTLMQEAEEWFGIYKYRYTFGKAAQEREGYLRLDTLKLQDSTLTPGIPGTLYHLTLPRPVLPGDTLRFSMRFTTKFPRLYSRLGYRDGILHMAYWYPKVAAYDHQGWHPIDYHLWGEFYADFGRYEVELRIPRNVVAGFTGTPDTSSSQTAAFVHWLDSLAQLDPHTLAQERKNAQPDTALWTLRLVADSVHDVVMMLSPHFVPLKITEDPHEYWILVQPAHLEDFLAVAEEVPLMVKTYERWYGPYPYRRLTVVDGFVGVGGGMEYPQLVVIQAFGGRRRIPLPIKELQRLGLVDVICHEIAHQWFFGIVANNQMEEPWLDEAFATFTEDRFMALRFPEDSLKRILGFWQRFLPVVPGRGAVPRLMDLGVYTLVNGPFDEVIDRTPAYQLKNYGTLIYGKGSHVLHALRNRMGEALFDSLMREYVARYRFRHPHLQDFIQVAEEVSGQDLYAFFDNWLFSTRLPEYSPLRWTPRGDSLDLVIWNPGLTNEAVPVAVEFPDTTLHDTLPPGRLSLRLPRLGPVRRILVDPAATLVERDRWNNTWPRRWKLMPLLPFPDPEAMSVGVGVLPLWWPEVGWSPAGYLMAHQGAVRHSVLFLLGRQAHRTIGAFSLTEPLFQGAGRWTVGVQQSDVYRLGSWTLHREYRDRPFSPRYRFWNLSLWVLQVPRSWIPDARLWEAGTYGGMSLGLGRAFATPLWRGRVEASAAFGKAFFKGILQAQVRGSWPYSPEVRLRMGTVAGTIPLQERFSLKGTLWSTGFQDVLWPHRGPASALGEHVARGVGVSTASPLPLGDHVFQLRATWAFPKVSVLEVVYEYGRLWTDTGVHRAWSAGLRVSLGPVALYAPLWPKDPPVQWVVQLRL